MSLWDTLTGINGTTFILLLVFLAVTWMKPFRTKWIIVLRFLIILAIGYFFLVGWHTLDSVNTKNKDKEVSLKDTTFTQICNLARLYTLYGSEATSKDFSQRFDCQIINKQNIYLWPIKDKQFIKIGEIRPIISKQVFTIIDLVKTESYGLGAGFGGDGVLFYVLKSGNRTYIISKSDLETEGEIK